MANAVPLNTLSLDTDWKAPNDWNGWEWNTTLFPDASSFLDWASSARIAVTLNVHSGIADDDPRLPSAQAVAGGSLASATCTAGPCKVWDWSSVPQAQSNFSLQQSFEHQGVSFWWLDWCCDASTVTMPGLTPDAWIDHLYAQEMVNRGRRGFVLARIGGSESDPEEVFPAGPWSDHTSAIAFTGDAWGTWNTLAREAELTAAEASIGEPLRQRRHRQLPQREKVHGVASPGFKLTLRVVNLLCRGSRLVLPCLNFFAELVRFACRRLEKAPLLRALLIDSSHLRSRLLKFRARSRDPRFQLAHALCVAALPRFSPLQFNGRFTRLGPR